MASEANVKSANFDFLRKHDAVLVRYAALAERYVFDDPNTALIKLGQFGELLAQRTAASAGVYVTGDDKQVDVLSSLRERGVLTREADQLFHGLRRTRNNAVHNHAGDRREALHQLRMARSLAVWFHKSFGNAPKFKAGSFVPPPDPAQAEKALLEELERLREKAAEHEGREAEAKKAVEEAERRAEVAYAEVSAALELAEETQAQATAEIDLYEDRLVQLQAETVAAPVEAVQTIVQTAFQLGEELDLDEADTRKIIDAQLREAGWEADTQALKHAAGTRPVKGRNIAIAEWPTASGPADYVLFSGLTPIAVVEAKRKQKDAAGAIEQAKRYSRGFKIEGELHPPGSPWDDYKVPFLFATNGRPYLRQIKEKSGIWFLDAREPTNHPRPLEAWYTPEGMTDLLGQDIEAANARLEAEPTDYLPLRDYQDEAVRAVESEIAAGKREMLVAMATGTGKTITCIGLMYRLIKAKRFRRILFLVDRSALGSQAADSLKDVRLENLQTFPDIYDVKELGDMRPDPDTRLHISTVQGMVKRLLYPTDETQPVPVDWYDCIIIDECHRGYNLDQEMTDAEMKFRSEADYISKYRRVIEHFDAVRIGLTATPALHTSEIFGPPVYQYTYRQAVIDGWLVDHEPPFRLITRLGQQGMKWQRGEEMKVLDTRSNQLQLFNTPDEVNVEIDDFNRKVITENFNKVVCAALAQQIDPDLPGKTLIFCVNDLHAQMVERLMKEAFEEQYGPIHDDTVKKITGASDKPLLLIRRYKNEQLPKVAVTVDLLTTGIDVPAIENIVFIRKVRSRILFEQMLGRATRLCENLHGQGEDKQRFQIFDAVDIYQDLQEVSDMHPVVTRPSINFDQLVTELHEVDDDEFREGVKEQLLAKLRRKRLNDDQKDRVYAQTGMNLSELIDHTRKTSPKNLAEWFEQHEGVTDILDDVQREAAKFIVSEHHDELLYVERGYGDAKRPEDYLDAFRNYIKEKLDELPALVVVTQRPRDLTRKELRELRLQLDQAGFSVTSLRTAWRETTNQDIAASIIGYIRHVALDQPLISHSERVQVALQKIVASRSWTAPQRKWLERIGKQLEQEVIVDREAIDSGQFKAQGGFARLNKVFDGKLEDLLREITEAMWQTAV